MNGSILYRGPSALDGAPIVVVVTGLTNASSNAKTGAMLQTWILRSDVDPLVADRQGLDASICGDCPHRRQQDGKRTCYVTLHQAPLSVYRAFTRGVYQDAGSKLREGIRAGLFGPLRIGSYGDPAAVPVDVWASVCDPSRRQHTGYTHQWRHAPHLRPYVMASVDSTAELAAATTAGWRCFVVRGDQAKAMQRASPAVKTVQCPSDPTLPTHRACADCRLCAGSERPGASVWISAHGPSRRAVGRSLAVIQ
jgi:hypothetical protein